jgi:integrase
VEERGTSFDREGFNWLVKWTGKKAGLPFQVHAHMLRHAAGYTLGECWQGHPVNPGLSRPQRRQAYGPLHPDWRQQWEDDPD